METSPEVSVDVEVVMDTEETITMATKNDAIKNAPTTTQEVSSSVRMEALGTVTMATKEMGVELRFLCAAHDYLGSVGQGWCVRDGGCFLKTMVARLREELRQLTAHTHKTREVCPHLTPTLTSHTLAAGVAEGTGAMLLLSLWTPSQESQGPVHTGLCSLTVLLFSVQAWGLRDHGAEQVTLSNTVDNI